MHQQIDQTKPDKGSVEFHRFISRMRRRFNSYPQNRRPMVMFKRFIRRHRDYSIAKHGIPHLTGGNSFTYFD